MWLFFVAQYNSSLSSFVPNFRILSQVVVEKSLTEKSLQTDRQTMLQKRQKTIYPYILRIGGIMNKAIDKIECASALRVEEVYRPKTDLTKEYGNR